MHDDGFDDEFRGSAPTDSFVAYLPWIAWQRRWWIVVPLAIGALTGLVLAVVLPASYESKALLLVESAQMGSDVVGDSQQGPDLIDRRIAKIREQALSRRDLIELIQANDLYPEMRGSKPLSEIVDKMRGAIAIAPVSADINSAIGGSNTIAFSLSYTYSDPFKAQLVAQNFVDRLVKLDTAQTAERAADAVDFLQSQATALMTQINEIEGKIGSLTTANGAALAGAGTMMIPSGAGGYQAQIAQLQRENSQLVAALNNQSDSADRDPVVSAAEAQLATARATYADNHPDVHLAEQRLAEARKLAARNQSRSNRVDAIQAQIAANNGAIARLNSAQSSDDARTASMMSAQARGPAIAQQIEQLRAKAEGLRVNYQAVSTKLIGARAAANMADQQKTERLSVIDAPVAPDKPTSPNRPLVALIGLLAGGGLGLALVLLLEMMLRPIRGVAGLARVVGAAPLVIVPELESAREARSGLLSRLRLRPGVARS